MKVLQLITKLKGGGAQRLMVDLSNELSNDHEVSVISLFNEREKKSSGKCLKDEIKIYSLNKSLGFEFKMFSLLYKTIRYIQPDVIHNHLRSLNYLIPIIPFLNRVPIIHTIHSDAFEEAPNKIIRNIRRYVFKYTNIIPVTISKQSTNSFLRAYGNLRYKEIMNGRTEPLKSENYSEVQREVEKLKLDGSTKIYVHIGRLASEKNQFMLLEAFKKLVNDENANAILLVIGEANHKKSQQAIKNRVMAITTTNKQIIYLGYKENATDYLHASDFFCLSSNYEGMPITLIESLATECIPVCTPVGGMPEIVTELDKSLIPNSADFADYYELLRNVLHLSKNDECLLKIKARKVFEQNFQMTTCAERYEELYKSL